MKKTFYLFACLAFVFNTATAQVQFKLNYDRAEERYTVALVPDVTYPSPQNITGTAQVTLKVPTGNFKPVDIISYQPGLNWESNSVSEGPIEAPEFDYFSFGVIASGLVKPNYQAGEEMPLFSFKNTYGCMGVIALMDNQNDPFLAPNSKNANVGNQYTILGAGGNTYAGNVENGSIDCSATISNGIDNGNIAPEAFIIYPNPAVGKITVEFDWKNEDEEVELGIYTIQGKLINKQPQTLINGFNKIKLNLSGVPKGTYFLEFKGKSGQYKTREFVKIGA